jgi:hypothetical protein
MNEQGQINPPQNTPAPVYKCCRRFPDQLFEPKEKDDMFRRLCTALILILFLSLLCACSFGGGAGGGTRSIQVQTSSSCQSATGQDSTCTITLNNSSSSTGNFDWTASSSPPGAQFNPSSGSIEPGGSSGPIQVTIPSGICPFTLTFADANGTTVSSNYTSC